MGFSISYPKSFSMLTWIPKVMRLITLTARKTSLNREKMDEFFVSFVSFC
jgi:hypothetical protein